MTDAEFLNYEEYIERFKKTANQRKEAEKAGYETANQNNQVKLQIEQTANQEADNSAVRKQVAINEIIQKIPQLIPIYEQRVSMGKKLTMEQKETLAYILSINRPPEWMPRVQKLFSDPSNFE